MAIKAFTLSTAMPNIGVQLTPLARPLTWARFIDILCTAESWMFVKRGFSAY
jgi:hypothetical protein